MDIDDSPGIVTGVLPANYYATIDQRFLGFIPDVATLHAAPATPGRVSAGAAALKSPRVEPTVRAGIAPEFRRGRRVEVYETEGRRLVAAIEVVSPSNKSARDNLDAFLDKCVDFLRHGIHLVLMDVIPPGTFDPHGIHAALWHRLTGETPAAPAKPLAIASYAAGTEVRAYVEELSPGDTLPDTPLFLDEYGCVEVPNEAAYARAFEVQPPYVQDRLEPARLAEGP